MSDESVKDLTRQEARFLSERAPDAVRSFAQEMGTDVKVRTSAYRKIAAAARAERSALQEVVLLGLVRHSAGDMEALRSQLRLQESRDAMLEQENKRLRGEVAALTALPATAVYGEGTRR